jgi:hypothetical protein
VSLDGLKIVGANAPTMSNFVKLSHVDIDDFKKSDSELASLFGAVTEKENKNPLIQGGVYDVLKKGKEFSYFRQFAIDLACTEPEELGLWASPNLKNAHGAAIMVLGELYKILNKDAAKPPATTTTAAAKRTGAPTTAATSKRTTPAVPKPPASAIATEDLIEQHVKKENPR